MKPARSKPVATLLTLLVLLPAILALTGFTGCQLFTSHSHKRSVLPNSDAPRTFASASCYAPDGTVRCGRTPKWNRHPGSPNLFASSSGGDRSPTTPPSWTVPAWAFDPQNVSTCASDDNDCTQTICGAPGSFQGPCLTQAEIAARLGTYSPNLAQNTLLTVMSPDDITDTMYLSPNMYGSHYLDVECALPAPAWTTTLGTVVPLHQATGQLLTAVIAPGSGTVSSHQLVINTTHPSAAYPASNSGTTWTMSPPTTGCTSPASCAPSAVRTWAQNDTVSGYNLSTIYLAYSLPTSVTDEGLSVFIHNCLVNNAVAGGAQRGSIAANNFTTFADSVVLSGVGGSFEWDSCSGPPGPFLSNIFGTLFRGAGLYIYGGIMSGGGYTWTCGSDIDGDTWFGNPLYLYGEPNYIGNAYIGDASYTAGKTVLLGVLWGGTTVASFHAVVGSSYFQYPAGAGGATASLMLAAGLYIGNSSNACSTTGGTTQTITCNIALTPTNLDAPASATGFGGNAFALQGGTFNNGSSF